MRVRWQTPTGEFNAPTINELAAGYDSDEHRGVTVLGDADGRGSLRSPSRHVFSRPDSTGWLEGSNRWFLSRRTSFQRRRARFVAAIVLGPPEDRQLFSTTRRCT